MEVKARLKYVRVPVQKAREVANCVRGKNVNIALQKLTFMKQKTAFLLRKLIESAVANAEEKQVIDVDNLYVKKLTVDQAPYLRRMKPGARGRAKMIRKKQSHFDLVLDEKRQER